MLSAFLKPGLAFDLKNEIFLNFSKMHVKCEKYEKCKMTQVRMKYLPSRIMKISQ